MMKEKARLEVKAAKELAEAYRKESNKKLY